MDRILVADPLHEAGLALLESSDVEVDVLAAEDRDYDTAVRELQMAVDLDPEDPVANYDLGGSTTSWDAATRRSWRSTPTCRARRGSLHAKRP